MKRLLLLSFLCVSCSCGVVPNLTDAYVYNLLEGVEYYDFEDYDTSDINSFTKLAAFVSEHVYWKEEQFESWDSPEDIMARGYDDCDGIAITFINLAHVVFGIKCDLVLVETGIRTVVEGGRADHVMVRCDGIVYSAYTGQESIKYTHEIKYIYTFDEVFGEVR